MTVESTSVDRSDLTRLIHQLEQGLVERSEAVRFLLLALLAGEHLLLIGPPGTAKSELARRLHRLVGGEYFERLLTRFSVPEELFGPLSLAALDEGRYERDIVGYLPCASIAFLDEVFKANSAILNALLTLLNEREFDQGAQRLQTPLLSLIAASNELAQDDTLAAFEDRFLLRCVVEPVSDEAFACLLNQPATQRADRWTRLETEALQGFAEGAANVVMGPELVEAMLGLRRVLRDKKIEISDRRWVRAMGLVRAAAWSCSRSEATIDDLWVLKALVGEQAEQAAMVEDWYCEQHGARAVYQPLWAQKIVLAFEQQLGLEASATELAFDDSGKLSLMKNASAESEETLQGAAPRMSAFSRRKKFSASHIGARIGQIHQVLARFDDYLNQADQHRQALEQRLGSNALMPPALARRLQQTLEGSFEQVASLKASLMTILKEYQLLPLTELDDGKIPEPVEPVAPMAEVVSTMANPGQA